MKKIIAGLVSLLFFVASMAMAKATLVTAPIVCSPSVQTVSVGDYVSFLGVFDGESGMGATKKTVWSAPGGSPSMSGGTDSGATFVTSYAVVGDYFVTATLVGHGSSTCEVIVQ